MPYLLAVELVLVLALKKIRVYFRISVFLKEKKVTKVTDLNASAFKSRPEPMKYFSGWHKVTVPLFAKRKLDFFLQLGLMTTLRRILKQFL